MDYGRWEFRWYNANGWAITDAQWEVVDLAAHMYRLKIGHTLPDNLDVGFTVEGGTVAGSQEVTIAKGSTISESYHCVANLSSHVQPDF